MLAPCSDGNIVLETSSTTAIPLCVPFNKTCEVPVGGTKFRLEHKNEEILIYRTNKLVCQCFLNRNVEDELDGILNYIEKMNSRVVSKRSEMGILYSEKRDNVLGQPIVLLVVDRSKKCFMATYNKMKIFENEPVANLVSRAKEWLMLHLELKESEYSRLLQRIDRLCEEK